MERQWSHSRDGIRDCAPDRPDCCYPPPGRSTLRRLLSPCTHMSRATAGTVYAIVPPTVLAAVTLLPGDPPHIALSVDCLARVDLCTSTERCDTVIGDKGAAV